ncbi:hypothetical protein EUGRSUZ_C00295 [Eucalyptus grandis]|uniref:Uncharacterized protein n=2 Tax=Eucalyptus grandis TaxID=71139 RepID=A0ACC3LAV6_EUCGR|nr:hypothetical protein EUGRSUZ_C00295 [Eucalyptus grandis]
MALIGLKVFSSMVEIQYKSFWSLFGDDYVYALEALKEQRISTVLWITVRSKPEVWRKSLNQLYCFHVFEINMTSNQWVARKLKSECFVTAAIVWNWFQPEMCTIFGTKNLQSSGTTSCLWL